jgi:hypothetical protein
MQVVACLDPGLYFVAAVMIHVGLCTQLVFCNLLLFDVDDNGVVWNAVIACWHQLSLRSPVKAATCCSLDLPLRVRT